MNKEELEIRKIICRRLQKTDPQTWNSLTEQEKEAVLDEYNAEFSLERVGVRRILDDSISIRRESGLLVLGVLLGAFGGSLSTKLFESLPENWWTNTFVVVAFFLIMIMLLKIANDESLKVLRSEKVLKFLVDKVRKNIK